MSSYTVFDPSSLLDRVSGRDLVSLCQTSHAFRRVCADDSFWKSKVEREYSEYIYLRSDLTWRQFYLLLISSRFVPFIVSKDLTVHLPNLFITSSLILSICTDAIAFDGLRVVEHLRQGLDESDENDLDTCDLIIGLSALSLDRFKIRSRDSRGVECRRKSRRDLINLLKEEGVESTSIDSLLSEQICRLIHVLDDVGRIDVIPK